MISLSKTSSDPKGSPIEPVSVSQFSSAPNSVDAKVLQHTGCEIIAICINAFCYVQDQFIIINTNYSVIFYLFTSSC